MIPGEPPLKITIRSARVEDIPQMVAIDVLSFSLPWPERSFRYELTQNPSVLSWVVEAPDAQGSKAIAAMIVNWLIIDEVHIGTIAVHPDFRRRGIAQTLLAFTLLECRKRGAVTAYLEVRRSNLAAQALYTRFGFEVTGERRRYYQDTGEDALLMGLYNLNEDRLKLLLGDSDHTTFIIDPTRAADSSESLEE
jgi:[ribosomal protein S18]-alanine N-acetyltransferase